VAPTPPRRLPMGARQSSLSAPAQAQSRCAAVLLRKDCGIHRAEDVSLPEALGLCLKPFCNTPSRKRLSFERYAEPGIPGLGAKGCIHDVYGRNPPPPRQQKRARGRERWRERERGSRHTADGTHRLAEKSHLERHIPSVGLDFPKPAQQRPLNFTLAQTMWLWPPRGPQTGASGPGRGCYFAPSYAFCRRMPSGSGRAYEKACDLAVALRMHASTTT